MFLTKKKLIVAAHLCLIVIGAGIYANSINGEFIWDDEFLIEKNEFIRDWKNIPKVFQHHAGVGASKIFYSYRPLRALTFMLNYQIHGLDVRGYHILNILLHVSVTVALFWFLFILFDDALLAFLASLFFACHPVHTEAVAYLTGRSDPMATLFMLLAFAAYLRYDAKRQDQQLLLVIVFFLLAMFSKEVVIILPVLILFYHAVFRKKICWDAWAATVGVIIFSLAARLMVNTDLTGPDWVQGTLFQRLPGAFAALVNYLRVLIVPFHLHAEYTNELFLWQDRQVVGGMIALVVLLFFMARYRKKQPLIVFALGWFLLGLLPVLNIFPTNSFMKEHYLYFPSIGFFILMAFGLSKMIKSSKLRLAGIVLSLGLVLFYSIRTFQQNRYWGSKITFYERTLRYAPFSARIYNNLGLAYKAAGRLQDALKMYQRALSFYAAYPEAYYNTGIVYNALGRIPEAIAAYESAIQINPDYGMAYNNLGKIYADRGEYEKAIPYYKKAAEIHPNHFIPYHNLSLAYREIGLYVEGINAVSRAIAADPNNPIFYVTLGNLYQRENRVAEAKAAFEQALQIDPRQYLANYNLGNIYFRAGRYREAVDYYLKAIESQPDYLSAYVNIAYAYFVLNDYAKAIHYCDQAARMGEVPQELLSLLSPHR